MQEWNRKRKTMRHYDFLAPVYDNQYSEEQRAKIEAALDNARLNQNARVLDLGCGTGLLFQHVTESVKLVVGLDFSVGILHEANRRAGPTSNIALVRADADHMPFQNRTFDHVFAITLLQNTPNPLETLQEIERVSNLQSTIALTGLKQKFTQERFLNLLHKSGLKVFTIPTSTQLKGYLAVCKNKR